MIRQTEVGEMRMIRVRTAESRVFCEAYLVLRRQSRRSPIYDIVGEAEKIIREYSAPASVRLVRPRVGIAVFFIGVLSGVAATAAATAIALLCLCS